MNEGGKDNISPPMDSGYHNRLAEHITGFSFEKMPDLREKFILIDKK